MDKTTDLNPDRTSIVPSGPAYEDRPAAPSGNKDIDEIRAEIEKTRQETIRTINELERRLSPSRLMAEIKEKTREATVGRASAMARQTGETSKRWGTALVDTLKNNPIPTMMLGGGLAWLIANGVRREAEESFETEAEFIERRRSVGTDVTGTYGMGFIDRRRSSSETIDRREKAAEKAAQVKSRLRDKTDEARGKAAEWSNQVREKASQTSEQVKVKAQELGISADEYRRRAQQSLVQGGRSAKAGFFRSVESNPLAVAGVMMAAGAAIGLLFPETTYEHEKMGPQRDQMLDRAREAGREKIEQVQAVVQEAKESAKDEAERQGLVSRETSEKVEQKAAGVGQEIRSEAEEKSAEWQEKSSGSPGSSGSKGPSGSFGQ
ncbi:MAG: DUF3618 domain-containing protein [Desulfobacteraceae bacterium]|nr:MAG: DUF3618 domain-containing protein [Desulfobacteraceae bacterium]